MSLRRILYFAICVAVLLFFSGGGETRAETPEKIAVKAENQTAPGNQKELTSVESYIFIAEKNLFNPDRTDFPIQTSPQGVKKPVIRPQITLYGVTIAGDYQSASIAVAGRPLNKGEREIMTLKVGETVGECKLAKILPDRIILDEAGDSFEVLLYDSKVSKRRIDMRTSNRPVTVTNPFTSPTDTPKAVQGQTVAKEPSIKVAEPIHETGRPLPQVTTQAQSQTLGGSAMVPTQVPPASFATPSVGTPPTVPSPYIGQPIRRTPRGIPLGIQNPNIPQENN